MIFVCVSMVVLITIVMLHNLKSGRVIPPALFLFLIFFFFFTLGYLEFCMILGLFVLDLWEMCWVFL